MRTSVLLIAHGSRRAASNDEIRALTQRLREQADGRFYAIDCAFLELAVPLIPDGIQAMIDQGAQRVIVLPYFLAAGRHISEDIPAQVGIKKNQHPHIKIDIVPYLGTAEQIPGLLLSLIA